MKSSSSIVFGRSVNEPCSCFGSNADKCQNDFANNANIAGDKFCLPNLASALEFYALAAAATIINYLLFNGADNLS